jgi:uncharacterized membrane protein YhiD involved in acid resistance
MPLSTHSGSPSQPSDAASAFACGSKSSCSLVIRTDAAARIAAAVSVLVGFLGAGGCAIGLAFSVDMMFLS